LAEAGADVPGFVVTLPKITAVAEVAVLDDVLAELEALLGIARIPVEIMVETTQCIVGADGRTMLPALREAANGRLRGAHFGTYDFTAANDIPAAYQGMRHPACDFAKQVMKSALAGTGVWLSDGATNIMPVGDAVRSAWRVAADDIRHSLAGGFYQGWDLHPAQLPARFGAVYAFFAEGLAAASARLANFVARAAQATLVGDVFDDAATGQALLNYFLRGMACGALGADALPPTGLPAEDVATRSFVAILARRRAQLPR